MYYLLINQFKNLNPRNQISFYPIYNNIKMNNNDDNIELLIIYI